MVGTCDIPWVTGCQSGIPTFSLSVDYQWYHSVVTSLEKQASPAPRLAVLGQLPVRYLEEGAAWNRNIKVG